MGWKAWTVVSGELPSVYGTRQDAVSAANEVLESANFYEDWGNIEDAICSGYVKFVEIDGEG